jgi:hypothetical protein
VPKGFENVAAVSSSSKDDINKEKDLNSFKIEVTQIVSALKRTVGSSEESQFSSKKLSQVKYPRGKFKKIKGAMRRKIFNLTHSSENDSSGDGKMSAQLKEENHVTRKKE